MTFREVRDLLDSGHLLVTKINDKVFLLKRTPGGDYIRWSSLEGKWEGDAIDEIPGEELWGANWSEPEICLSETEFMLEYGHDL